MAKMPYTIQKIGAAHAQQEAERKEDVPNAEFKHYGFGDTIYLDSKEVASGKWDHLMPRPLVATRAKAPAPTTAPAEIDPSASLADDDAEAVPLEEENDDISADDLEALIEAVEGSDSKDALAAARQKVIDADLFEEGTVPTSKSKLIQALSKLKPE